ncbi:MAG: hypothetical protein NUV55_13605 [Sulfuricaulis sp.]|uniref:hypothetical protein n=1 Tax=Sulfuricaulis sp. TaxID=2003553 RepID=UPI0025CCB958|nr:hypothetical protein [Sulfuricaulis sp.]MCR4348217.1 hypothetical protein [Sulfuricaulis sp.]
MMGRNTLVVTLRTVCHGRPKHDEFTVFFQLLALFLLFLTFTLISHHRAEAASDDYLKAIDAEGQRLEPLGQAKKEQEILMRGAAPAPATESSKKKGSHRAKTKTVQKKSENTAATPAPAPASVIPASTSFQEFERSLSSNFPGSYALYSMLSTPEKEAVFGEYQNAKTGGTIRFLPAITKIIAYSSKRGK